MLKSDLAAALASKLTLSRKDARAIVDTIFGADGLLCETLLAGESVELHGFGTFTVKVRKARMARNLQTNRDMPIPAAGFVKFNPATKLKAGMRDVRHGGRE